MENEDIKTIDEQQEEPKIEVYAPNSKQYLSFLKNKIETWKKFLELYDFPVKIKSLKNYIPMEKSKSYFK